MKKKKKKKTKQEPMQQRDFRDSKPVMGRWRLRMLWGFSIENKFNIQYFILRRNINGGRLTCTELHKARLS